MTATDTATVSKPTTWQLDPAHTQVEFAVRHLMISTAGAEVANVILAAAKS